ncbi:unnamed protein product, partial [Arabidopsis halleri]
MKNSSLLFILIVVFVISSSENGKMIGEAKKCSNSWICEGDEKCKEKCMADYKGNGTCYYPAHLLLQNNILSFLILHAGVGFS